MSRIQFITDITADISAQQLRRAAWVAAMLVAIAVTIMLLGLRDRAVMRNLDAATQTAWLLAPSPGNTTVMLNADIVFARFKIKQASGSTDISWTATTASELRTSLMALELARIRLTQVKITRSGQAFIVSAERAP